ncbi:MAG: redoxin domain-containing protein [Bacteroidales bacterium]
MNFQHFLWIYFLLLFHSCSASKTSYPIDFHIEGFPNQEIYIAQIQGDAYSIVDTVTSDEQGVFSTSLPSDTPIGMYSFLFPQLQNVEIPFIFNKEPKISFSAHIKSLKEFVSINASEENKTFYSFSRFYSRFTSDVSHLQDVYESYSHSDSLSRIEQEYKKRIQEEQQFVQELLKNNKNTFVSHIIQASRKPYSPHILHGKELHTYTKKHFFDYIDFSDTLLIRTNILTKKSIEYLTLCSQEQSEEEPYKKLEKAVITLTDKALPYPQMYDFIIDYLISGFEKMGAEKMVKFVSELYVQEKQCSAQEKSTLERKALHHTQIATGNTIPDFSVTTLSGTTLSSKKLHNKPYILIFWSTSCGHCQTMIPDIAKYMNNHTSTQTVFISLDESQKKLKKFMDTHPSLAKHSIVCDEQGWDGTLAKTFFIYATPTIIMIQNNTIQSKPLDFNTFKKNVYNLTNTN